MKTMIHTAAVSGLALALAACGENAPETSAAIPPPAPAPVPLPLFDGQSLDGWIEQGEAEWRVTDGEIVGTGDVPTNFILTNRDYYDFVLTLEFWISAGGNSGVFFRCANPEPTDTTCYEANIFDIRPDQSGRTGALVNIEPPMVVIDTEERWNTYEIRAEGERLTVILNGETTVDIRDTTHTSESPIFLQVGPGEVRFRNIAITEL